MNIIDNEEFEKMLKQFPYFSVLDNKSILITGASGLIAFSLIKFLYWLKKEKKIRINIIAVVRNKNKFMDKTIGDMPDITVIEKDVVKGVAEIDDLKVDYVIHAASNAHPKAYVENPVDTMLANLQGTINYLEFFKYSSSVKFMYISSSEIYGDNNTGLPLVEDNYGCIDTLNVRSSYSESKRAAETLCIAYSKQFNINTVIARPGYVYGPSINSESSRADAEFINRATNGSNIVMKSKGSQLRSYCYVQDCVTALIHILIYGERNNCYNVASEINNISLRDFAEKIANHSGVSVEYQIGDDKDLTMYNKIENSILDISKIKKLGWKEIFTLDDGISNTLVQYRNRKI